MADNNQLERFLDFSAAVTAFSVYELRGTGQAEAYLDTVVKVVGEGPPADLLALYGRAIAEAPDGGAALDDLMRRDIFSDERLGPIARNIVKLWYIGTWYGLPPDWHAAFHAPGNDGTFVVSASSYTEGLIWPAIGANPPGAKGPGFGTWAAPPRITEV